METNKITIVGTILNDFEFDHIVKGETFYNSMIRVERLSGHCDDLPIIISDKFLTVTKISKGDKVTIVGQIRTFNQIVNDKNKLRVRVFVQDIINNSKIENDVYLNGYICTSPTYRTTPMGREITDILVAVNRRYHKSDYIPCIVWGRNAKFASTFKVGDKVAINGRLQSRIYVKKSSTGEDIPMTAYEVSVQQIVLGDNLDGVYNNENV